MKKIIAIMMLAGYCFCCHAQVTLLNKTVSIEEKSASLFSILNTLSTTYGIHFSYSKEQLPLDKKMSITLKNVTLADVLDRICEQTSLVYQPNGDQILLKAKPAQPLSIKIKGKVIDHANATPLAFASISVSGTSIGVATNVEGEFILNIPVEFKNRKIIVSYIGYSSYRFTPSADDITIELEEDKTELNTVEVTATPNLSLLEEALSRIKNNYDTNAIGYTFFLRDLTLQNEKPIGASEAVYQSYRGAVESSPLQQIKFIEGRKSKDYNSYQKILSTFIRWTGFEVTMDINSIFLNDLALEKNSEDFPSSQFLKQHQFTLLGLSRLQDRDVYIIAFDQKDQYKKKSLYKGKLYIDTETLAFIRVESALSDKGIEHARFMNSGRAMAAIFGFGECSIESFKTITNYKNINGQWYVNDVAVVLDLSLQKSKQQFVSNLRLQGNLVVTNINTTNPTPFSTAEILTNPQWKLGLRIDDKKSWSEYNVIPTDPQLEEAFKIVSINNQQNGFDKNFWRRYHPYKQNPALLVQDSINAQQLYETKDAKTPFNLIPTDTANKLRLPKYESLSRTLSSPHFTFYFTPTDSTIVSAMSLVLEESYQNILQSFQLRSLQNAIKVEVYPSVENYHFAIDKEEAPDSDIGMATGTNEFKIVSPSNPGSYHTYETIMKALVHEFTHCVHYNFIEQLSTEAQLTISRTEEAAWLFEAIALYGANQFYNPVHFAYLRQNQYPTLQTLNDVERNGKIYDIGFIIIEFIKYTWGNDGIINLLKQNGDVQAVFNLNNSEFEEQFYSYLEKKYLEVN